MRRSVLAVVWSRSYLRLASITSSKSGYLLDFAHCAILPNACVDHQLNIINVSAFVETFVTLCKRAKIKPACGSFVITSNLVMCEEISYDHTWSETDLKNVSTKIFSALMDDKTNLEPYMDYEVLLKEVIQDSTMLVVATRRKVVDSLLDLAKYLRLKPYILDVDYYVIVRFMTVLYDLNLASNECVLLLTIDSFEWMGYFLTASNTTIGQNTSKKIDGALVDDDLLDLSQWLLQQIHVFVVRSADLSFKKIYIYGENVDFARIVNHLKNYLSFDIELINPFKNFINQADILAMNIEQPAGFVLSLGLALREV